MRKTIKIGKRGKDLAFRIPKALVEQFDLKVGDSIDSEIFKRLVLEPRADAERDPA